LSSRALLIFTVTFSTFLVALASEALAVSSFLRSFSFCSSEALASFFLMAMIFLTALS